MIELFLNAMPKLHHSFNKIIASSSVSMRLRTACCVNEAELELQVAIIKPFVAN
jgi:hypothetical protein